MAHPSAISAVPGAIAFDERSLRRTWGAAAAWGISTAIIHRVLLMIWLPLAWSLVGGALNGGSPDFHTREAQIPALSTGVEQQIFGVWRRWDAVHYFDLATNGYRADHPGPTVFGPLTPALFSLANRVVPSLDAAAALVETIAFAAALTFLYRFVHVQFASVSLARWSVVLTALGPLSFFFAAPLSEAPYFALAIATCYLASRGRYLFAGLCGALAVLTRTQAFLLLLPSAVYLFQGTWQRDQQWFRNGIRAVRHGWPLILLPAAWTAFDASRSLAGLPPSAEVYRAMSYLYFTNPVDGLVSNLRWMLTRPQEAALILDSWALIVTLILAIASVGFRAHRRVGLQVFTWGFLLLFLSKMNFYYGTDIPYYSQSFGRYSTTLFPLTILVADGLRRLPGVARAFVLTAAVILLALTSALFTLALAGP